MKNTLILALNRSLFAEEAKTLIEMFTKSRVSGEFQTIYQRNSTLDQLTASVPQDFSADWAIRPLCCFDFRVTYYFISIDTFSLTALIMV